MTTTPPAADEPAPPPAGPPPAAAPPPASGPSAAAGPSAFPPHPGPVPQPGPPPGGTGAAWAHGRQTAALQQAAGAEGQAPLHLQPAHGPWQPVTWRRWPGPARPAPPAAVVAVFGAAALGTLALPLDRPGMGWVVAGTGAAAALAVAGRAAAPDRMPPALIPAKPPARHADRIGWAAATLALLTVGTFRAAGWLFALCVLASLFTAALAVGGGRSVRAVAWTVAGQPIAALRALPWLSRGAAVLRRGDGTRARYALTAAVAAVLLLVFGGLFASADPAFAELVSSLLPTLDAGTVARWALLFPVLTAAVAGAAYWRAAPPATAHLDVPQYRPVRRLEWLVPLAALVLLFAAFVAVQATVLFGGAGHVLRTAGLTYAEYARAGFWQLLVVTGLTLLVLAGAVRWAPRAGRGDRTVVRVLLGLLAGLTLLIVASALYRMGVYADAYGLTRLRILVFACELWLGAVFVMVLIAGVRLRAPWLPRAVLAAGVAALLGLAAVDPDRTIAEYNLNHGPVDVWYLRNLSADAVPALDRAPAHLRLCLLGENASPLNLTRESWYEFNLARERARPLLTGISVSGKPLGCPVD